MRAVFPDRAYPWRVVKRHALASLLLAALVLPLGLVKIAGQPERFPSWIGVVFDPRDGNDSFRDYPRFKQLAESLRRVATEPVLKPIVAANMPRGVELVPESSLVQQLRARIETAVGLPPPPPLTPERLREQRIDRKVEEISNSVAVTVDEPTLTLSLRVSASSPEEAQAWADRIMDAWIKLELKVDADRLGSQQDTYRKILDEEVEKTKVATGDTPEEERSKRDASLKVASLQERETELMGQIQDRRSASSEASASTSRRRAEIESELSRRRTTLSPSHPDVIAKEAELRDFERSSGGGGTRGQLRRLADELGEVRTQLRAAGATTREDSPNASYATSLTERLNWLMAERLNLERQIQDPIRRTRLRVVEGPTIATLPEKSRFAIAATFVVFSLLVIGVLAATREFFSDRARDAWRVAMAVGRPPLAVLERRYLRKFPEISPQTAEHLRRAGSAPHAERTPAGRVLNAYRELIVNLKKECRGRRILFVSVGDKPELQGFYYSLANLFASDTGDSLVLLDFDAEHPVASLPQATSRGDVLTLLTGETSWQDTRIARSSDKSFDHVPPPAPHSERHAQAFRSVSVRRLFDALDKAYRATFVRGPRCDHILENGVLGDAATDIVFCIAAEDARLASLKRALKFSDLSKVRGFVLVGA